jgi:hypothetical protein
MVAPKRHSGTSLAAIMLPLDPPSGRQNLEHLFLMLLYENADETKT